MNVLDARQRQTIATSESGKEPEAFKRRKFDAAWTEPNGNVKSSALYIPIKFIIRDGYICNVFKGKLGQEMRIDGGEHIQVKLLDGVEVREIILGYVFNLVRRSVSGAGNFQFF